MQDSNPRAFWYQYSTGCLCTVYYLLEWINEYHHYAQHLHDIFRVFSSIDNEGRIGPHTSINVENGTQTGYQPCERKMVECSLFVVCLRWHPSRLRIANGWKFIYCCIVQILLYNPIKSMLDHWWPPDVSFPLECHLKALIYRYGKHIIYNSIYIILFTLLTLIRIFWGPCGPQKALIVAPTVIKSMIDCDGAACRNNASLSTSKRSISFVPDHTDFGVCWTPQIPKVWVFF